MKKIAITGGIGSGKTYVSKRIYDNRMKYYMLSKQTFRIHVFDMDSLAKCVIYNHRRFFTDAFGDEYFLEDGKINKRFVLENIFTNKKKYDLVNTIVKHLSEIELETYIYQNVGENDILFVESAIVFEANMQSYFDNIILVYANEKTRFERALKRGTMNIDSIKRILSVQQPDEDKIEKCNYIISNGSDCNQIDSVIDNLMNKIITER